MQSREREKPGAQLGKNRLRNVEDVAGLWERRTGSHPHREGHIGSRQYREDDRTE